MKIAVYPGSFNPWHEGHQEILYKALDLFDQVIIAVGVNATKYESRAAHPAEIIQKLSNGSIKVVKVSDPTKIPQTVDMKSDGGKSVLIREFWTSLPKYADEVQASVIIRGIRNINDFEYEKTLQYNYEDLGMEIPIVNFISGRNYTHISSSSIKAIEKFKGEKDEK
jgi:pantetheine-phosphate adenylyltransferase